MTRDADERRRDTLAVLERNADAWLATSTPAGTPHLIAVSTWWDGENVVIATTAGSRTARNLEATGRGRLGLGSPEDVVLVDVRLLESLPAADAAVAEGFAAAAGWDPREEAGDWRFFRLAPQRVQAYRGYSELEGRDVMRGGRWL